MAMPPAPRRPFKRAPILSLRRLSALSPVLGTLPLVEGVASPGPRQLIRLLAATDFPLWQHRQEIGGIADPTEDAALRLDHFQRDPMEFRKIGSDAVGQHQTVIAAIVGFADRGIDADLSGDPGDNELADVAVAQDAIEAGGVKRAFAGLVDHRFAGGRL